MRSIFFILFFLSYLFSFDESSGHFIEALSKVNRGEKLYLKYCASCHHENRIGIEGPPLFNKTLRKYKTISILTRKIKDGFPQTLMPKFDFLSEIELIDIAKYIKQPLKKNIKWTKKDIINSTKFYNNKIKDLKIKNIKDIMPVVERGANKVWIMEGEKVLDKFNLKNVHGGIKFTFYKDLKNAPANLIANKKIYVKSFFVPTRDGIVAKYSLKNGRVEANFRACINLRNVSLSRDGKKGFVTCLLPRQMVVFDTENLNILKVDKLEGKVSAIYDLYSKDKMIFTYRDKPVVGFVNSNNLKITYKKIDEPIEDFFIDPFEEYLIATARGGKFLRVYQISNLKKVYEAKMSGMPHLFSATYWYKNKKFYFATPHLRRSFITIWQMYDWKLIKKIDVGGDGFFVKTNPYTPYLWCDNGSDELVLIDKENYKIKKIIPKKGKRYIHTEYSSDGKFAYLSIYERNGELIVLDADTLQEITSYPANIPVGKYNLVYKNRRFYPETFGATIFKEKCWGCHHQSAEAFGPSFTYIANHRNKGEIIAQIISPQSMYKQLGYKRNSMPSFNDLSAKELEAITEYIFSFKN